MNLHRIIPYVVVIVSRTNPYCRTRAALTEADVGGSWKRDEGVASSETSPVARGDSLTKDLLLVRPEGLKSGAPQLHGSGGRDWGSDLPTATASCCDKTPPPPLSAGEEIPPLRGNAQ
ncbi:unnamed protein product [Boreogadus saida]